MSESAEAVLVQRSPLRVGAVDDPAEVEAEAVADRVMRMPDPGSALIQRCPGGCPDEEVVRRQPAEEEEEDLQRFPTTDPVEPIDRQALDDEKDELRRNILSGKEDLQLSRAFSAPYVVRPTMESAISARKGGGSPLPGSSRRFFEPRFGADLSPVRVHHGAAAAGMAASVNARAFTVGSDVFFGRGEWAPGTTRGDRLMAHEIAHTLQREPSLGARRAPAGGVAKSDVCTSYDAKSLEALLDMLARGAGSGGVTEPRKIVLALKYFRRCEADDGRVQAALDILRVQVGEERAEALWDESGRALGGHVGLYPSYAADLAPHLRNLGVEEVLEHRSFQISEAGKTNRRRAADAATKEVTDVARADILYFRGHQYAQYLAPGMFADWREERGVDLRYLQRAGGFPHVKVLVSTSCATLCNEALDVFNGLFPNAAILGFAKTAPRRGRAVRVEFEDQISALKTPLILAEPADAGRLVSAWKSAIAAQYPKAAEAKSARPGYFHNGVLEYWNSKAWISETRGNSSNSCKRKRDFRSKYPAPPPLASSAAP